MKKQTSNEPSLFEAFLSLSSEDEVKRFMRDLCTPKEIEAFIERWEIAKLLFKGKLNYRDIAEKVSSSTTTVTRVARFLNQEPYEGYKIVLGKVYKDS